ncbi:MAG TPA: EAL domain-containing protein [Gammaproteobacteria bacterium]|jgi:diguanylate cyclase (GGDEF)-like protein/PAS domain S-box-containing protein|nr:EAL domain-containing protein [Gammaproteobacteria bacterium]
MRKKKGPLSIVPLTMLVTAMYAVTGYLGLGFASGSAYSTAIWIPSGIALGAVIVYGLRTLPAIFFGSLIVNYLTTRHGVGIDSGFMPLVVGITVASGAVLQAFAGWAVIRARLGLHNSLNEPNDILQFAFYSGPISCLVNTSTSNIALVLLGVVSQSDFLSSWITWYVGDAIGVLIFTPVFLILFAKPRMVWRSRVVPVLLPLCGSFFVVSLAYTVVKSTEALAGQVWFVLVCGFLFCVLINIVLFIIQGQKYLMQLEIREVLRSAGECIFSLDENEKIIFANPASEKMWNLKESELIGKSIHEFVKTKNMQNSDAHDSECPIIAAIKNNKTSLISNHLLHRSDGSSFWAECVCSPLVVAKKNKGAVIIMNDISERREAEFRLERLAHYDTLTGLPNRYSFIEKLRESITQIDGKHQNLTVCFLDLDNFKSINDNLGHETGDITLQMIALLIAAAIPKNDYFARLGGDEFGIILGHRNSIDEVNMLVNQVIQIICQPLKIRDTEINLSLSVGVALYPDAGVTANELIKNADIAMYRAKYAGKNTFVIFNQELSKSIRRQHLIESELHNGLVNNEYYLVYQPQIDIIDNKIIGLEVLIRWKSKTLGEVSPSEFISIAEKNGYIHRIGEWVLSRLIIEYNSLRLFIKDQVVISMNISTVQLRDSRFYNNLVTVLSHNSLITNFILEVTESVLMENTKDTISQMQAINDLGIKFSLDDFGVNYSSMSYLKHLPISQIKIDYLFIKDIVEDNDDKAIVKSIIQLANGLDIPTIAEGVETKEQLNILSELGCRFVQGYYFYKPMPLADLIQLIKDGVVGD